MTDVATQAAHENVIEGKDGGADAAASSVQKAESPRADIAPALEAVLLTADRPLTTARLGVILGLVAEMDEAASGETPPGITSAEPGNSAEPQPEPKPRKSPRSKGASDADPGRAARQAATTIKDAAESLNRQYEQTGRSFRIEQVAGGYRIMTLPAFADAIARLHATRARTALTQAALETLAILAYKQPVTRAHLEAIRGVACGEVLRTLIDRKLVTIAGRAEELGRPLLYATTKRFLETFGLSSLKDLPSVEELRAREAKAAQDES